MSINLYRVIQPVHDIEVAQRFYSYVFDDAGERVSPGRHYFHCGNTILACYDPDADGDGSDHTWMPHGNQYLYFAVSNLDAVLNRVREAGGTIVSEIETMPWGERLFYCKDPFANPISFVDQTTVFNGKATGSAKQSEVQDAIEAFEELMTGKVSIMQEMVASINAPDGSTKLVDILYRFGHRLREFHNTAETHFARHFHEKLPTLKMKEVMQRHEAKVTEFITTLIRLKYDSPHADDEEICRAVGLFETLTCAIPRTIQRGE